ncbi:sigma factor [Saccharicrinis sp. 156]|uniref:sigma factor n=1 Tax=Saccharicrinis sp. 156 TaxID=3417574 RepID=UPI003D35028F
MKSLSHEKPLEVYRFDQDILKRLRNGDRRIFEVIFEDYYDSLVQFAEVYVFNRCVSEDIVQDFFVWLWENNDSLIVRTSLKAYFFQSVKNRCFDYLKHLKVKDKYRLLSILDKTEFTHPKNGLSSGS